MYIYIYLLTRATLMSPGKDKTCVCGYIYIIYYIYIYIYISACVSICKYLFLFLCPNVYQFLWLWDYVTMSFFVCLFGWYSGPVIIFGKCLYCCFKFDFVTQSSFSSFIIHHVLLHIFIHPLGENLIYWI